MKRRNQKKLTLDQATVRELKTSDFERSDGAALFSPISPISSIAPIRVIDPVDC